MAYLMLKSSLKKNSSGTIQSIAGKIRDFFLTYSKVISLNMNAKP